MTNNPERTDGRDGYHADGHSQAPPATSTEAATTSPLAPLAETRAGDEDHRLRFHVVALGASAGGLEAFERFFHRMPPDSGITFVLMSHLDPTHKSIMVELIKNYTRMPVFQIEDNMALEPNCVYIIPPNRNLAVFHGRLQLLEPDRPRSQRLPIDAFFRSLAADQEDHAIGIVLSGTGSDGTLGLKAIKGNGGMTMVQEIHSARYDGMPRSAIATGMVDYVVPVEEMSGKLLEYTRHTIQVWPRSEPSSLVEVKDDHLDKIFLLLRAHSGNDFAYYKRNTTLRRIERRMQVHQLDKLAEYTRFLQQSSAEVEALFKDLLISVSSFFRDPDAFTVLESQIIPAILANKSGYEMIRVWSPGCASGEEAYSVAILLAECLEKSQQSCKVKVFATDIDAHALEVARTGRYPESIAADMSPTRLRRYFTQEEKGFYQVNKGIRDMVVFAVQNVIKDPPFSTLDLIMCRNLLIYFEPILQKRVLPLFHYGLNPRGYLMLGSSETLGESQELFRVIDKKWKIFRRSEVYGASRVSFPFSPVEQRITSHRREATPIAEGEIALHQLG